MSGYDLKVDLGDISVDASVSGPSPAAGFLVAFHGAAESSRDFFLYEHLARVGTKAGWTAVRYERRPTVQGVPLDQQVADAAAVVRTVRGEVGSEAAPVGLWGFSQGAWTATLSAQEIPGVSCLILIGYCAVTPGRQMRFATRNYLRAAGYRDDALRSLSKLRTTWEAYYRGELELEDAQPVVDRYRSEPWFDLAHVPAKLPPPGSIDDPGFFDFEPSSALLDSDVPALLFYGEEDIDVPVADSVAVVERLERDRTVIRRFPGAGHDLTRGAGPGPATLESRYEQELAAFLRSELPRDADRPA